MRSTAARAIVGTALAIGLPLAVAGYAGAQSGPSQPTGPSGPSAPSGPSGPSGPEGEDTTPSSVLGVSQTPPPTGGAGLARTGGEAAIPLAASAAAITVVLGGRRLASRFHG